jgi:GDSL-like Lipase/Acylhydrolase family
MPAATRLLSALGLTAILVVLAGWFVGGAPIQLAVPSLSDTLMVRVPSLASIFSPPPSLGMLDEKLLAVAVDTLVPPPRVLATRRVEVSRANYSDTASLDARIRIVNEPLTDSTRPLDAFFGALYAIDSDSALQRVVRIAHYGDSQIEGDRITEHIRRNLIQRFGGGGVGYVPLLEPATHHAMSRAASPNWRRYTVFQYRRKDNPFYFLSGQVFRYGAGNGPTLLPDSMTGDSGQKIAIRPAVERLAGSYGAETATFSFTPSRQLRFQQLSLLTGRSSQPATVRVSVGDSVFATVHLSADSGFQSTRLLAMPQSLLGKWRAVKLDFSGPSPDVYGMLVDGPSRGIQVDNYGLRGHAGHGLKRIDGPWIGKMVRALDTRLIIIQYGGNVVRYDTRDFRFYEQHVYEILMRFRMAAPEASLLVVGVGDMAEKQGDQMGSFATVPLIRDAQRRAALRAGAAFWDLYQMMGGSGSMVTWANAKVPLAASDYAHFSPVGQRLVGNLMYRALMNEYAEYVARVQAAPTEAGKAFIQSSAR